MTPARSLFRRSDRRKPVPRRWHAVFVHVRGGGAAASAVVFAPRPGVVFVIVDAATIVTVRPPLLGAEAPTIGVQAPASGATQSILLLVHGVRLARELLRIQLGAGGVRPAR